LIIALPTLHPHAEELARLARHLRSTREKIDAPDAVALAKSLNLTEVCHGGRTFTYRILPGTASAEEALQAYHFLNASYPGVIEILMRAAQQRSREVTVEIGTMNRRDDMTYSKHEFIRCMPQILSNFRAGGSRR
jgi:hypothetical protein